MDPFFEWLTSTLGPGAALGAPEQVAAAAAGAGVPPPSPVAPPEGVGASLEPTNTPAISGSIPTPRPRPPEAGPSAAQVQEGQKADLASRLQATLKGVQAVQPPTPQRISSPSAPRPVNAIKGGDIVAYLNALSQAGAGGMKLPSTLGAALGGR